MRLSVELARIACELDAVVSNITREPISGADADLFSPSVQHLEMVMDQLQNAIHLATYGGPSRSVRQSGFNAGHE